MLDFFKDLIGGTGGLFGGGGGGGGLFSSPIFGNVIGAIGMALLQDDPAEAAEKREAGRLKTIRESSYGYTGEPPRRDTRGLLTSQRPAPKQPTAARYLPEGRLV